MNFASGLRESKLDITRPGYIVVETNYRIYAYTGNLLKIELILTIKITYFPDSPLQIALLGLFTELQYRFPNLVLGNLTRDSVRQALRSGITANQIINFLNMHSHSESMKQGSPIPATVKDQIKLWEIERDRFLFTDGILYSQFLSLSDFELLRNYASVSVSLYSNFSNIIYHLLQDAGYLIWDNPAKRVMVVAQAGHDDVRRFWKRHKKDH